ncbi:MAG: TonB-dependent receptor [Chitinophagales bacterium]|nr:TonB-dependent receptor [Chitinophagales bacterium]
MQTTSTTFLKLITTLSISFLSLVFATKALAQNDSIRLDEVIIYGDRLEIPFSQSIRDIQIITKDEIDKIPATSLNGLLAYIGGIDIRQRGPFGGQADISIDGGSFEQTLVLLNGIPLVDDQTAHNMMNIPLPLVAIDHIEVLRGAAARVYGINALTGAINIVTKKEKHSSFEANLYGGSSFQSKEADDGNGIYGGGGLELFGQYGSEKHSQVLSFSQNLYNGQRYNTAQNNTRALYNGEYRINAKNSIQALAGYTKNKFGANGFYAAPGDINSEEIVKTALFNISSQHQLGRFTIKPGISDRYNEDDYRYFKDNLSTARSRHFMNTLMVELNTSAKTKVGDFGLGWSSRLGKINSSNIGQHRRNNHGINAEYKKTFGEKWLTQAGVYVNYNTDYGWQVYPGVDVAYLFYPSWKISASVGSGQRIPSFTDLYLNQLPGNIGNADIQPERAWNYETKLSYDKKDLHFQVSYFYRNISEFIDWVREDESFPYSPINSDKNNTHGFQTRLQQGFHIGGNHFLQYKIQYHYLHPQHLEYENLQSKYIFETLKHQLIAGIQYGYKNLSVQVENRLIKRELNKAYNLLDLRIAYQVGQFLVYTDITNLLNSKYNEVGAIPTAPRWFNFGVRVKM